jgi:DNA polymerase zeta
MSIGYFCKRAEHGLGFKVTDLISRSSSTFAQFNESYYRRKYYEEQNLRKRNPNQNFITGHESSKN